MTEFDASFDVDFNRVRWLYYNFCNWLNVLNWGISSINGMVVAVVCYLIGYFVKKNQR